MREISRKRFVTRHGVKLITNSTFSICVKSILSIKAACPGEGGTSFKIHPTGVSPKWTVTAMPNGLCINGTMPHI